MKLEILISKKGTQVVTASNLHGVLRLPDHKYNTNVTKWLQDIYAFKDDVRKAIQMKDYAEKSMKLGKHKDYYLSLEMARLITLTSDSPLKQKLARHFLSLEGEPDPAGKFSKEQIMAVLEITKVMGLVSCQKSVELQHQAKYNLSQNPVFGKKAAGEKNYEWWRYRAKLLGYSVSELKDKMKEIGKNYKGKSLRAMLMYLDKYEVIRMAVVDFFLALGRSETYATNMGDLAKIFAKEMKVEIWDDRNSTIDFTNTNINPQLLQDVKSIQSTQFMQVP